MNYWWRLDATVGINGLIVVGEDQPYQTDDTEESVRNMIALWHHSLNATVETIVDLGTMMIVLTQYKDDWAYYSFFWSKDPT
jgi:hypothetical protein